MTYLEVGAGNPALVRALELNLREMGREWAKSDRMRLIDEAGCFGYRSTFPHPALNALISARFAPAAADRHIAGWIETFAQAELPFIWWVGPLSQPADLGTRLERHGLTKADEMPGMRAELPQLPTAAPLPDGLTIVRVHDEATLTDWGHPAAAAHKLSPPVIELFKESMSAAGFAAHGKSHNFVGYRHGQAVACATILLGSQVAGLYNIGTLPAAQRQGIGTAMTLALMRFAAARGYQVAVLQASDQGKALYERLGFSEICRVAIYAWQNDQP